MRTNLTIRNLIGAFVGGVAGILTCYYVSMAFMPFGCLVGVVLGFWHDKLITDYRHNLVKVRRFLSACRDRLVVWKNLALSYAKMPAEYLRRLASIIPKSWKFWRHVICELMWFVSMPLLFIAWLRKHPMNRANTITVLLAPLTFAVLWASGYFSLVFGKGSLLEKANSAWTQFAGFGLVISTFFILMYPVLLLIIRGDGSMAGFYRQYSRYSRYGPVGWTIYELKNVIMFFVYVFILAELMLGGIFMILATFLLTIAIIIGVVIPARVFWRCVQLPGHWFCFGVTMTTTLITWFCLRDHVVNPAAAWTLAVGNGIISAAATEALRRGYAWLVSKWSWLYELVHLKGLFDELDDTLNFLGRTLGKPVIGMIVGAWRIVKSYLPQIHIDADSFWLPV